MKLSPSSYFISIFTLSAILMVFVFWSCQKGEEKQITLDPHALLTDADYVGSQTCGSCHQEAFKDWLGSHHDQAMMPADEETVKGDFNTEFYSQGVRSKFFKKDGKFFVITEGPEGEPVEYEVIYTFGIYPLQQYMVQFPGGRLQCLRTAWDTEKGGWFDLYPDEIIDPGEWIHWTKGGQNWNTMCADCHSTNVQKNFDPETDTFHTTYSIINVSCESCHGPGKNHVEWATLPEDKRPDKNKVQHLHLTSKLTSRQHVDQCARCHSRRTQHTLAFNHVGEYMDHYTPEVLRPGLYHADGQILDEVYVYGSFTQSRMYMEDVQCTDCHNPHSLELKAIGNALCLQCHEPKEFDTPLHHFHEINTDASQCINCHMTGRYYMGNDFRRDHSFRIPRPDQSVKYGTPNACNGCHENQSAEWAAKAVEDWYGTERPYHFSEALLKGNTNEPDAHEALIRLMKDELQPPIARATAIWYLDQILAPEQKDAIKKMLTNAAPIIRHSAITSLTNIPAMDKINALSPLLSDPIRSVRINAAKALANVPAEQLPPAFPGAKKEYETSLLVRSDFPGGQFERGIYLEQTGNLTGAVKAYQKAVELDGYFNPARLNLAFLYNRMGKQDEAIATLEEIIRTEPAFGDAYYYIGLIYAEKNDLESTIKFLEKGKRETANPRLLYNLGIAYQQTGKTKEAEQTYLEALEQYPDFREVSYALATLYLQTGQNEKAKPIIRTLLSQFPNDQELQRLWQMLNR